MRARTGRIGLVGVLLATAGLAAPGTTSAGVERYLLPDLTMRPPTAVAATPRKLEFGSLIGNRGLGPLEVRAFDKQVNCPVAGNFNAMGHYAPQLIYNDDNDSGLYEPAEDTNLQDIDKRASCIVYHQPHAHYHYRDFSRFTLKRVLPSGKLSKTKAVSKKISFCVIDTDLVFPGLPAVDDFGAYGGDCNADPPNTTMGISVGHGDHYSIGTQGQSLKIKGLPDGKYCLIATVDPKNKIVEAGQGLGKVPQVPYSRKRAKNTDKQKLKLKPGDSFVKELSGKC